MKLLILTQYFPPETGAPQNRLFGLARHLVKMGVDVSVLTAMPNYPAMKVHDSYRGKKYVFEHTEGIAVHRSSIYVSQKRSVVHRLRNYFSFVVSSARANKRLRGNFDFLFCESPPLFLGYSAMYLARKKNARLIFNVSDLWPESAEKLGVVSNRLLLRMAYRLEAKLYRRATLVTGQTQGICDDIVRRFPQVRTYWLPNGADVDDFDPHQINLGDWRQRNGIGANDFVFLYAGILGIAQGLEIIIDAARNFVSRQDIWFVMVGDGPERAKLLQMKNGLALDNVRILPPVAKSEMPVILANANASIIPLKDIPLFYGAIPSKIFECLAMKVPVLLGVNGEARRLFVEQGKCALHFRPGDPASLTEAVNTIVDEPLLARAMAENGSIYVKQHFDRPAIAKKFFEKLVHLSAK